MRTHLSFGILGALLAVVPAFMSCGSDEELPRPPMYVNKNTNTNKSDAGTVTVDPCQTEGHAGCPCSEVGKTIDCGTIEYASGDYVTCSMGQTTCDGVKWGLCVGNRIVAQSIRGHALTPAGRRLLSTTQDCQTPCDPRCMQVVGEVKDIDAGGLTITNDGGVTLTQSVGSGPGTGPCKGLWCNVDTCAGKPKTSISGVVYDPAGKVPLYNAYVYIPVDPTAELPAFTSGVSCDTCAGATDVSAVAVAQTGADGKFTLNNVPYGNNLIPLVVQMGKWRRKVTLPKISPCEANPIDAQYTRLPRNRFDGDGNKADIPHMALASGSADPFECLLLKAGIDPAEIKIPTGDHRIDYYRYNGKDIAPGGAPAGSTLTGSLDTLKKYDVVLLPCEGKENTHNTQAPNVEAYANLGGRMFTTHFGYIWLATPSSYETPSNLTSFYGTAKWKLGLDDYSDPMTAVVDQTFPKGVAFAQWMQNVGATTTIGKPVINEPRHNALTPISPTQRWVYGSSNNSTASYRDMLLSMTFNTPISASVDKQCGRVVFSDFHVSADALTSTSTTTCSSDNDCGFTATCSQPTVGNCAAKGCTSNAGCTGGFSCNGAAQGSCSTQACYTNTQCGTGRSCVGGSAGSCLTPCYQTSDCGWGWSSCNGGSIGTCAAASCKADGDCGVGTCNGESIGSCVPAAKSCWTNPDCTSLNASATCAGAVTGTCSTACKTSTDCGTGSCSGATVGSCKPPTTSCFADSTCTSLNAGSTCSGETLGTCSVKSCTADNQCGTGTCSASKTCYKASNGAVGAACTTSATCPNNYTCVKLCSNGGCSTDTQCGTGRTCGGESAGTCTGPTQACNSTADCTSLGAGYTCSGGALGTCPARSGCKSDTDCGGTRVCNGETAGTCTGPTLACWDDATCKTSLGAQYSCSNAVVGSCSSVSCKSSGDCGGTRACTGANQGTCSTFGSPSSCGSDSECTGTKRCIGGTTGTCAAGTCYANGDCGTTGTCNAGTMGACKKSCTTNADCGSLTCVSGECQGCTSDSLCASNNCVGETPRTCSASGSMFPLSCRNGDLSGQEKALEFMLFDLSACVSPDSWAPPVPSISYSPITFTLDFESKCSLGQLPVWREFDWKAEIPSGTNITFSVQTADTTAALEKAQLVPLGTATTSTVLPGWDVAIIETTTSGAFQSAVPRVVSLAMVRVTVTLNPSADKKAAPTLTGWQTAYDCLDRQ